MILSPSSRRRRSAACGLAAALVSVGAGCGGSDDAGSAPPPGPAPVVATTSIWADIVSEVLCGVPVPAIIPSGADPHSFEPSLQDRRAIEDADVIVANGAGLEDTLSDLIGSDAEVIEIAAALESSLIDGAHSDGAHSDDDDDDHADVDPHVWQDPTLVIEALDVLAEAGRSAGYDDCSSEYAAELRQLDRDISALIDPLPAARRVMVTSHDALGYFADRYGLEIVGTVIPAANTLAETNAADLAALSEIIEQRGVGVIFTEELASSSDAEALARRLGVDVVPLVTDALSSDPATDTYVEMMRSNAETIAAALSP